MDESGSKAVHSSSTAEHQSRQQARHASSLVTRYQYYGRELVLFLLQHGQTSLQLYLKLLVRTSTCVKLWLQENASKYGGDIVADLAIRVLKLLRRCWRPLRQLLCGLVSLQLCISLHDDLDSDNTKMSARINSCLTLLFGAIRCASPGICGNSMVSGQAATPPARLVNNCTHLCLPREENILHIYFRLGVIIQLIKRNTNITWMHNKQELWPLVERPLLPYPPPQVEKPQLPAAVPAEPPATVFHT